MLANPGILESTEKITSAKQKFHIGAPTGSQLPTGAPVSLTTSAGSLDLEWPTQPIQDVDIPGVESILDDILERTRREVDLNSSSARAHANLGSALVNRGQLDEAAKAFEAALSSKPTHFFAKASLGRIRTMQGNFAEAKELYESLKIENPNSTLPLLSLAHIAMKRDDRNQAIELIGQAIDLNDREPEPHYQMAVALLAAGKPNDAIRHLRAASRFVVLSPSIYHSLGVAFAMGGESSKAVRAFKTALALSPEMRESIHALADLLLRDHKSKDVVQFLAKYLEKNPDDCVAHNLIGLALLEEGESAQARGHFLQSLKGETDEEVRIGLLNNIGVCYARQRQLSEAISWYARATVANFRNIVPYHNIARLRILQGDVDSAQKIVETCLINFPSDLETHVLISQLLRMNGRVEDAVEHLQGLVAAGRVSEGIYSMLTSLLVDDHQNYLLALEILKEGHRRFPSSVRIINNLSYALLMTGEVSAAEQLLASLPEEIVSDDRRTNVTIMATRGLLALRKGDLVGGAGLYRRAESLARKYEEAILAQIVRQKMHLELARAYAREESLALALEEIKKGIAANGQNQSYERDLIRLGEDVLARSEDRTAP
jgi:tetratricopeptide (TPR) repeat protein